MPMSSRSSARNTRGQSPSRASASILSSPSNTDVVQPDSMNDYSFPSSFFSSSPQQTPSTPKTRSNIRSSARVAPTPQTVDSTRFNHESRSPRLPGLRGSILGNYLQPSEPGIQTPNPQAHHPQTGLTATQTGFRQTENELDVQFPFFSTPSTYLPSDPVMPDPTQRNLFDAELRSNTLFGPQELPPISRPDDDPFLEPLISLSPQPTPPMPSSRKRGVGSLAATKSSSNSSKRPRLSDSVKPKVALDRSSADFTDDLDFIDLVDRTEPPAELLKPLEDRRIRLGSFQCVICMDDATGLTVTHCGMTISYPAYISLCCLFFFLNLLFPCVLFRYYDIY